MKIIREWLGGKEEIDLSTNEGMNYWINSVVQDEEEAYMLQATIRELTEVTINLSDPEYIERYTYLEDVINNA